MKKYNVEHTFQENQIIYEILDDSHVQVVDNLLDTIVELEIPQFVEYKNKRYIVSAIASEAFLGCRYIDAVEIPKTVKFVGAKAFEKSDVKSVLFYGDAPTPNKMLEMEQSAFSECIRLEYIRLPNNLKKIPDFCFLNCLSLVDIEIGYYIEEIGDMAFFQCELLQKIDFMDSFKRLGNSCFQGTNLYYAEVHENIEYCGDLAFADIDNLQTVVIANPKAAFGDYIVKNDHRVTVYIKGEISSKSVSSLVKVLEVKHHIVIDDFLYWEEDGVIYLGFSKRVGRVVGYIEKSIRPHTIIKDHVGLSVITDFGPGCFKYSDKLISCVFPKTITSVKSYVFEGCHNLESVTFNHKIDEEDAKRVVANENAKIFYHAN